MRIARMCTLCEYLRMGASKTRYEEAREDVVGGVGYTTGACRVKCGIFSNKFIEMHQIFFIFVAFDCLSKTTLLNMLASR